MALSEWIEQTGERLGDNTLIQKVESVLESLSPRDRKLLIGLVFFFLVGAGALGVYGMKGAIDGVKSTITTRQDQVFRAQGLIADNQEIEARVEAAEVVLKDGSEFIIQSYLEREALAAGITQDQIPSIQVRSDAQGTYYTETVVEVQLKKVDLGMVVKFLHAVEYADRPVHVKALRVRTGRRDRNELDVDIELTVVKLNEGA